MRISRELFCQYDMLLVQINIPRIFSKHFVENTQIEIYLLTATKFTVLFCALLSITLTISTIVVYVCVAMPLALPCLYTCIELQESVLLLIKLMGIDAYCLEQQLNETTSCHCQMTQHHQPLQILHNQSFDSALT